MANENRINATFEYNDGVATPRITQITDCLADSATAKCLANVQSIGTSAEAFALGECTSPGWFMAKNLDDTNYVEIYDSTSGHVVGKMLAGESYGPVRLGSDMQAPAAKAHTAACLVEYQVSQT